MKVEPITPADRLAAPAAESQTPAAANREVIQAVHAVNRAELFGQGSELTFILDRNTHRPLIRIVDRKTREVIRQIPPEHVLRLAESLPGLAGQEDE
jgi:flagellar protein FlaG